MKHDLFAELRRRNVPRAAVLYAGAIWALAQGIAQLGPAFGMPDWGTRWFVVAGVIGFPFWIAFAWFFKFTPEGLKRESAVEMHDPTTHHTGRKLDFSIIGVLTVAVVLLVTDRIVLHRGVGADVAVPVSAQSIAVLPFVDMSPGKDQEYFSDGISEELLNLLAKIPQLQVTARTSSFSFKGKDVAIPEIAKTLHVAHVLEGSVRKAGNSVRITAQLIRAGTDKHVWSQTYDRTLDDIFAIQDEIAADVVKQLKLTLLDAAPKVRTTDPEAYAQYLQAKELARQFTGEGFEQSNALYRKVLATDPLFAPAWAALASNLMNATTLGLLPNKEGYVQARAAAEKALAIDPDYGPAHSGLGWIVMYGENDLGAAARHFKRALELDPADLHALGNSALLLQCLGRLEEAVTLNEALVRRDPVNLTTMSNLGLQQRTLGRFDAAIATYRNVLSLSPIRGGAHYQLGVALMLKGDAKDALAQFEQETNEGLKMIGLPMALYTLGQKADSDTALAALIAKYEEVARGNIAYVYAYRGEADQAFAWLDKTLASGDSALAEIVTDNLFEKIRADPRWLEFLRKLGYTPEQLAKIDFKVTLPNTENNAAGSGANH